MLSLDVRYCLRAVRHSRTHAPYRATLSRLVQTADSVFRAIVLAAGPAIASFNRTGAIRRESPRSSASTRPRRTPSPRSIGSQRRWSAPVRPAMRWNCLWSTGAVVSFNVRGRIDCGAFHADSKCRSGLHRTGRRGTPRTASGVCIRYLPCSLRQPDASVGNAGSAARHRDGEADCRWRNRALASCDLRASCRTAEVLLGLVRCAATGATINFAARSPSEWRLS